jgi:hypothetical protein
MTIEANNAIVRHGSSDLLPRRRLPLGRGRSGADGEAGRGFGVRP